MSTTTQVKITRQELYAPGVTRALEKEKRLRGEPVVAPPVSPIRRLFLSSLFYLPLAGLLASLVAWLILEPNFHDQEIVGGEVMLVNTDPMEADAYDWPGATGRVRTVTVGSVEAIIVPGVTLLEDGANGEPAFESIEAIEAGEVVEVAGALLMGTSEKMEAHAIRPASHGHAAATGNELQGEITWARLLYFPLTAVLIALALLAAEGFASRNWVRMAERTLVGVLLTTVFSFLAFIPAGMVLTMAEFLLIFEGGLSTAETMSGPTFIVYAACRSLAWAILGAALGLGMNMMRTTKVQLRNSVLGGALGGAIGGVFFDPIDRFIGSDSYFSGADLSRLVGMLAVGTCVGLFVALVDQLAREAWVKVRTGPLAGKAFVLYRSPTIIGSAPDADIYLFKDAEISAKHAAVHRVGNRFEIEDTDSRMGTQVAGSKVRRQRLNSGDQIVVGATVLEFEERAKATRS